MLRKCLTTTNIIESSLSAVEGRTGRVTRWRSGEMALRWAAAAALETERNFRKIPGRAGMGHKGLWMLKAVLDEGPCCPITHRRGPGEMRAGSSMG